MKPAYKTLFGPVPSRRFGRSLGVDLVPLKTCSLDCVYCQLGRTTHKTCERREYVPVRTILDELSDWKKNDGIADYITLSGSGEPTLHSGFGAILDWIDRETEIPSVLLSNATLFHLPEVREAAFMAGVVKMTLSVWNEKYFKLIHRPHPELSFDRMVRGIKTFSKIYKGQIWIEVFLIGGMNDIQADVRRIANLIQPLGVNRIHLNTAVRPPSESFVTALSVDEMQTLASLFQPTAEVIPDTSAAGTSRMRANEAAILEMLKRRPSTAEQISQVFGMHINEIMKYLGKLLHTGKIQAVTENRRHYYRLTRETQ